MILRPATPHDAPAITAIHREAVRVSLPFLPAPPPIESHLEFVSNRLLVENSVWVAEVAGAVVGYTAFHTGWVEHLFIHPDHQGRGLGRALLAKAMEDGTPRQLWTFQDNVRARKFYEARGFRAVEFTDGAGNMEKTPDVRYLWEP